MNPDQTKAHALASNRILTIDAIRGMAILFMTIYHQSLLYPLKGVVYSISYLNGYLAAPFFLAISGGALILHEQRHQWPFKMITHGGVLFLFAWCLDIIVHRSIQIDWDIFQVIGTGYMIWGVSGYLGSIRRKYIFVALLIAIWGLFPALRPDNGLFALWPYGIYMLAGYIYMHTKQKLSFVNQLNVLLFIAAGIHILFWIYHREIPYILSLHGILFALSMYLISTVMFFYLEGRNYLLKIPFSFLVRFGTYPLTLYFFQQSITRFCMKYHLHLQVVSGESVNWMIQAGILIICMFAGTFILDRLKFFRLEWLLRKSEAFILDRIPNLWVFRHRTLSAQQL